MRSFLKKHETGPLALTLMCALMWGILHAVTGISAAGPSAYNSYTLQALSWLKGRLDVDNREYLELAVYQGRYYVSFPPLPSVILLPFALLFGAATPDDLLVKIYILAAVILIERSMRHIGLGRAAAAAWAFLFAFGSSLLPITLEGAVWYHAQDLAFFLTVLSIYLITQDRPTPAILFYALSVACRPFNALYGIVIGAVYLGVSLKAGETFGAVMRKVIPGIVLGACVAVAIGVFNYVRFADPFEFGHSYLPEFSTQGGTQFSFAHIGNNIRSFILRLPFRFEDGTLVMERFGFSAFIACPMLTLLVIWAVRDIIKKTFSAEKAVIFAVFVLHFILLLMHRTFGGFQYGARYCADLMPYAFFYRLCDMRKPSGLEFILPFLGFVLAFTGAILIHL